MKPAGRYGTRERLLDAAAVLFAERGYRGATLREIADRAGANMAAANYYFGSKQALYLAVAQAQFVDVEAALVERGASVPEPAALERLSRDELAELLRARVEILLETLLASDRPHGALVMRELSDPSDALPEIVRRFLDPQRCAMETLVAKLAPGLPPEQIARCTRSLFGQVFFYRSHRPPLLLMMGKKSYPPGFVRDVSRHITEFTLGGIDRLAAHPCATPDGGARN